METNKKIGIRLIVLGFALALFASACGKAFGSNTRIIVMTATDGANCYVLMQDDQAKGLGQCH